MTKIDKELVDKIAHLARLEFENEAKDEIVKEMNNMLSFVETLNEIDTTGIEPLIYMSDEVNVMREDEISNQVTHKEALKNAPDHDSDYFRVPKFIDKKN
ncbi:MAG: Asp-tRNA(Asn)/Glu-tRNA(Gln) amidotransferase subunit GatC [Bacteroidota bacterium]|jgi:aspartyl-tRNA(Asn)/glutamyl-tRNA(Gln) amidotransferase subunit C